MRKKKEPTFAYGIEITKPFSKEMYDHNDMVAKEMKSNIMKLQRGVCYSGYGSGYTLGDVNDEFKNELDMMQNWQLHEEYSYGCFERLLPRTKYMMIGFDWCKHDYGTELMVDPHAKVVNKVVDRLMENSIDNQ